jgi:uncharacterized protein YjbJ (UPF0337 family)
MDAGRCGKIMTNNRARFRGQVQETWGDLTRDQLDVIAGSRDHLSRMIQVTYGISEHQAARQIRAFEQIYPN